MKTRKNLMAALLAAAVVVGLTLPALSVKSDKDAKSQTPKATARSVAPAPRARAPQRDMSEADRVIHKRLREKVRGGRDFAGVEFRKVIDDLRQYSGPNLYVKLSALSVAGIEMTTPVTVHLKDLTLERMLRAILEDVGGAEPLGFIVDDGVLVISTKADLSRRTLTQVYDVGELIDWTEEEEVNSLVELIESNVDQDSWRPHSDIGAISHLKGKLVVTQTVENHSALRELLGKLKNMRTRPPRSPGARARKAVVQIKLVGSMKETVLDSAGMGLIAVAGLRDEVPRDPVKLADDLERQLTRTNTLGLRNAIRLTLKDLYKSLGKDEKVLDHLRQMLEENDAALQKQGEQKTPR